MFLESYKLIDFYLNSKVKSSFYRNHLETKKNSKKRKKPMISLTKKIYTKLNPKINQILSNSSNNSSSESSPLLYLCTRSLILESSKRNIIP